MLLKEDEARAQEACPNDTAKATGGLRKKKPPRKKKQPKQDTKQEDTPKPMSILKRVTNYLSNK